MIDYHDTIGQWKVVAIKIEQIPVVGGSFLFRGSRLYIYRVYCTLFFLRNLQDVGSERQGLRNMLHMCQEMGGAQPYGKKSIVTNKKTWHYEG